MRSEDPGSEREGDRCRGSRTSGFGCPSRARAGAGRAGSASVPRLTRLRPSLTGQPRLSSVSSTSPLESTDTAKSRVPAPSAIRRAASATSGSARLRGWVRSTTSRPSRASNQEQPGQHRARVRRQVAGLEELGQGLAIQPRRVDRLAAVAGGHRA